jgi:hypothetical protein
MTQATAVTLPELATIKSLKDLLRLARSYVAQQIKDGKTQFDKDDARWLCSKIDAALMITSK